MGRLVDRGPSPLAAPGHTIQIPTDKPVQTVRDNEDIINERNMLMSHF